jgi:hypothetical protein
MINKPYSLNRGSASRPKDIMSEETQENIQPVKENDAEINLSRMRKKYERELQEEALARQKAEARLTELEALAKRSEPKEEEEEEEGYDPYVDTKKLKKTLRNFSDQTEKKTQTQIQRAVSEALENERKQNYLNSHSDFNQILTEENAEKFAQQYPKLADTILKMPESFERQKLVYENIKALGLERKENAKNTIQDKINQNRQHPGYQPSGAPGGAYANQGDFSEAGQKAAYNKMLELKRRMKIS